MFFVKLRTLCRRSVAIASWLFASVHMPAMAQTSLPEVTIAADILSFPVDLSGFADTAISALPMQATQWSQERLKNERVQRLANLTNADASINSAYNAVGYIDSLSVRGYTLDSRFNYQRDGLPMNAETALPLFNKTSIELLKGITGQQFGISTPGGAVNMVVKRPHMNLRKVSIGWESESTFTRAVDISQRFGTEDAFGLRINAQLTNLGPPLRHANGHQRAMALASDWRLGPDTLLEAEVENGFQSQYSQPGMSLIGAKVPSPGSADPRTNLNNQSWSLPVVFDNNTYSIRLQHRLSDSWHVQVHWASQRLHTDDRVAFPYGCSAENAFDRYCSNGEFDLYDYRSENELRRNRAVQWSVQGRLDIGGIRHDLNAGVLHSRFASRFQPLAYNYVGSGNIFGTLKTGSDASVYHGNTNSDSTNREWFARDAIALSPFWRLWTGLRHTRLYRESELTDGSQFVNFAQSFTTPWSALSYQIQPNQMAYASWGQGVESIAVPQLPLYANAGRVLPSLKSKQVELGFKAQMSKLDWSINGFDISRPQYTDRGSCDVSDSCTREIDGNERHRGIEAAIATRWRGGGLHASAMWLDAARDRSSDEALNGLRPVNVPSRSLRLQVQHAPSGLAGLTVIADWTGESGRVVLPDNSVHIPAWSKLDIGLRLEQKQRLGRLVWRAGIDNLFDRRAWKEAPYQYGHVYLFPLSPRSFHLGLDVQFE